MIDVKILNSLIPIFPDKEPQGKELSELTMCQNQAVQFQIAFKIADMSTAYSNFFIRIESDIPVSVYYINNVPVIHTSSVDGAPPIGLYPDILLPKKTNPKLFNYAYPWGDFIAEENEDTLLRAYNDSWQGIWFCINERSKIIDSGNYEVKIRLYDTKNNLLNTVALTVDVLPLKLPRQKLLYTNWVHYDCLSDMYNEEVFTDRYFEILSDYVVKASRNGMNMILMPAFTPPLDTGINCERDTVQLVKVTKIKGEYEFDFSLMKRFIDVCKKSGITHFEHSHFFTQWGAKNAPKVIVYENGKYKKMFGWKTKATDKAYVSFLRQYIKSLKVFLAQEKLEKKIMFHISDEPSESMVETYSAARETITDLLEGYAVGDAVSHIEFYEKGYCKNPISCTDKIHDFIGKCDNLWTYYTGNSSLNGRSSRVIGVPRERNRMLGIQLYYYNIKGFLHWGYNNYYGEQSKYIFNPAMNPCGGFALPGTSYFVYPSPNGRCFQSVRQKIFAEGLCDIQLLTLLEKHKGRYACNRLIEKYFGIPHFDKTVDNPQIYMDFEEELYRMLSLIH